jgi:hypothetical protein
MTDRRSPARRALALAGAAALISLLGVGCYPYYSPGGTGASYDTFTYESTPQFPQTVNLIDLRTNETLWSVDVPEGKQLVVSFYDDYNTSNPGKPALMRWQIMDNGEMWGQLSNAMPVPEAHNRLLEPKYRSAPSAGRLAPGEAGAEPPPLPVPAPPPPAPASLPPAPTSPPAAMPPSGGTPRP